MKRLCLSIGLLLAMTLANAHSPVDRTGQVAEHKYMIGAGFWIETKGTWLFKEPDIEKEVGDCANTCGGKKHKTHETCDSTCDLACLVATRHLLTLTPEGNEFDANFENRPSTGIRVTLGRLLGRMGAPMIVSTDIFDFTRAYAINANFASEGKKEQLVETYRKVRDHWNNTPCSNQKIYATFERYRVRIEWHLYYKEGDRIQEGGTGTNYLKMDVPLDGEFRLADAETNCKCVVDPEAPTEHGYIPGTPLQNQGYAMVTESGVSRPMLWKDIPAAVAGVDVPNMNQAIFQVPENITSTYFFPAGWELECEDGSGQDVQLQDDLMIMPRFAGEQIVVNIQPVSGSFAEIPIKVLCLEMTKPEPKLGMKYNLVPPKSPNLRALANIVKGSRFRGPWDQMRLWIATDQASFEEMSKVLLPMPGKGTYLKELYRTVSAGALAESHPAMEKMAKAEFLAADVFDAEAASWLVSTRLRLGQAELLKWLDSNGPTFAKFYEKSAIENQPPDGELRVGTIVSALMSEPDALRATSAIKLLGARPASITEKEKSAADFRIARVVSTVADEKLATVVLDWIEAKKPHSAVEFLAAPHPDLPPAIHERAAKILASYSGI